MSLDLQLSELRRSLDVAITKIDGQLAALLQKSDYAEQRARESTERMIAEFAARDLSIDHLDKKIDDTEEKLNSRINDVKSTVDHVRGRMYFMSGVSATIGGVIGIIVTLASKH